MDKKLKSGLLVGSFVIALFTILYFTGVIGQSVLSAPATAQISNGQVLWFASIVADNIGEGVGFYVSASPFTLPQSVDGYPVGTKIVPKDSVIVYISKGSNLCSYILEPMSRSKLLFPTLNYYVLKNPKRSILVDVCVDSDCRVLDAVNFASDPLDFSRNGGKLTVKGLGGLIGDKDCPNYQDVALVFSSSNVPNYVSLNNLNSKYDSLNIIHDGALSYFSSAKLRDWAISNIQGVVFVSDFDNVPVVNSLGNLLTGQMGDLSIGAGVVSVIADAKVWNSAFIVPSQQAEPVIDSLKCYDLQKGSTGSGTLKLSNDGDKGAVAITLSSDRTQISPSTKSITLDSSYTLGFEVIAPSTSGAYKITAKACGTSSIGSSICDSKTVTCNVLDNTPSQYCGDGVCNAGETKTTCARDCPNDPIDPPITPPLECKDKLGGLISGSPVQIESCGFWCKLGLSEPTLVNTCSYDYTPLLLVLLALIIFIVVLMYVLKKKRSKK